MLVGRAHDTEFLALFQSALDGAFPLAGSHVVQVVIVTLVAFGQSVAGIHLYERSLVSFGEAIPVVAAVTGLIAHVVGRDEHLVPACLLLPVFDGGAVH